MIRRLAISIYTVWIVLFCDIPLGYAQASQGAVVSETETEIAEQMRRLEADPYDTKAMNNLIRIHSYLRNGEEMLYWGQRLMEIGEERSMPEEYLMGVVSKAVGYQGLGQVDSMLRYYNMALELGRKAGDYWTQIMVYNGLGIYSVEVEMDYYKALEYFLEGVELAQDDSDPRIFALLCNIATTYYLRKDPTGLNYALRVYELGHKTGSSYIIYVGSNVCAGMYYILGEYDKALKYIRETESLLNDYGEHTGVYNLYANILLAMGREKEAVTYYKKALDHVDSGKASFVIETYLNYSQYLMDKGRYEEAVSYLTEGLKVSHESHNTINRYLLYREISECYDKMGNRNMALEFYKDYHNEADSIFNFHKERSIDELRVKYETERRERLLQEKELALLRGSKKMQITLLILVIILIALGATYILYRRRNKMYKQIARQQHDLVKMGRVFEETNIPSETVVGISEDKYSNSSLSDEKGLHMFEQLERSMREEKIYGDKDLTIEKLADKLGTNRTYLSQIINENTGASFNHYVNSYRINEAVRILSDADNSEIQLKALAYDLGFNYRETFYKSFQKAIGMSPSKYREEILKMYKR